jgi:hypothetical protein
MAKFSALRDLKCSTKEKFRTEKMNKQPCSARDWERSGLLEGIPRVVVQISALL